MESRIEEILKQLINGEVADFTPQSRVEEYLKSCVEGSGVEGLPTPQSRIDALLYALSDSLGDPSSKPPVEPEEPEEPDVPVEVNVPIPEELRSASILYHFRVNEKTVLFSSNTSGSGLWRYDIESNTFANLSTKVYDVSRFTMFGEDCLFMGSGVTNIWAYRASTDTVEQMMGSSGSGNYSLVVRIDENRALFSYGNTGSKIVLYDHSTKKCSVIYSGAGQYKTRFYIGETLYLSCWFGVTDFGILKFDNETNTLTQFYDKGIGWSNVYSIGTKHIITSTSSSGMLLYDEQDGSLVRLAESLSLEFRYTIGDYLCFGNTSDNKLVYLYDTTNGTLIELPAFPFTTFADALFVAAGQILFTTTTNGVILYSATDNTFTTIIPNGLYFRAGMFGDDVLIWSTTSTSGLRLYDAETRTVKYLTSTAAGERTFYEVGDGIILIETKYNSANVWKYTTDLYDTNTKTAKALGMYIDTVEKIGDNLYRMYNKDKALNKYTIEFDTSTMTFTKVEVAL